METPYLNLSIDSDIDNDRDISCHSDDNIILKSKNNFDCIEKDDTNDRTNRLVKKFCQKIEARFGFLENEELMSKALHYAEKYKLTQYEKDALVSYINNRIVSDEYKKNIGKMTNGQIMAEIAVGTIKILAMTST